MKSELSDFMKEVTKNTLILDKKIEHLSNIILLLENRMDTIQKDFVEPMLSSNSVLLKHMTKLSKRLEE